jgi:hypothetical protein
MNRFSKAIIIIIITSITNVFSQVDNFRVGPKLKDCGTILDVRLHENSLTVLSENKNELKNWKLSPVNLIPAGDANYISGYGKKASGKIVDASKFEYAGIISLDKKHIVLYNNKEGKDKTTKLFYQELDNAGKAIDKPIKLATKSNQTVKTGFLGLGSGGSGGFSLFASKDQEKVLLINQAPDKKINKELTPGEVTFTYYNATDMKELSSATFDLQISDFANNAIIGNNGYIYTLVKVLIDDKSERKAKKKNGEATWYFKIVGLNVNSPEKPPFEYDLIFKNRGILNAELELTENGDLICAGTYSELTRKGNIDDFDGLFYAKLNPETGEVLSDNQRKLDRSTVEFLTSKKNARKNEGAQADFKIRGFVAMNNGTSNLLLEEDYYYVVTTTNGKTRTTTYHYVSKSILIANIANDGEINWIKHIPKHQHTTNDNGVYNSFSYYKDKNMLRLIFNDNSGNYDAKTKLLKPNKSDHISNVYVTNRGGFMATAEIDENGNSVQKLLADAGKYFLWVKGATWSSDGKQVYLQAVHKIPLGQCILGCLFPPYGIYLLAKGIKPSFSIAKIEIE